MLWNYLSGNYVHHGSSVFLSCLFALGLGISPELWLPQKFRVSSRCQSSAPGPSGSFSFQGWLFSEPQFGFLHPPFLPHSCHFLCSPPHLWGAQTEQSDGRRTPLPRGSPGSAGQVFPLENCFSWCDCPSWSKIALYLKERNILNLSYLFHGSRVFPTSSNCQRWHPGGWNGFFAVCDSPLSCSRDLKLEAYVDYYYRDYPALVKTSRQTCIIDQGEPLAIPWYLDIPFVFNIPLILDDYPLLIPLK